MKIHEKKLHIDYAIPKMEGHKPFEIRKNDCDYQVGDIVHYKIVGVDGYPPAFVNNIREYFKDVFFRITYITDYEQKDGYIVYAEKQIK